MQGEISALFYLCVSLVDQGFYIGINTILSGKLPVISGLVADLIVITEIIFLSGVIVVSHRILRKLRRNKREMEEKNLQIEKLNQELERKNATLEGRDRDLSDQLSVSETFFRTLIESADDGIAFYDNNSMLKFANRAFFSIIGMTEEEYLSSDIDSLIHPDDKDYTARKNEAVAAGRFYETELKLKHKDGHYIVLSSKSVGIRDGNGNLTGSLTISRDISDYKRNQEELIKAKVEAESGNRLKASFLANISHEIRTPLNSVVGFANLLYDPDLPRELKEEYISHINFNSEKLLQIIGDIIDLSRLESSQLEITYDENSIGEIVREVIEDTRNIIRRNEKPIVLILNNRFEGENDLVFTDRVWLKRMLAHLLDNAVKFTPQGSVELSYGKDDNNIIFSVKDTGIGINKENISRIFENFNQEINGFQRPFDGLGIGLTLVKEVLQRMGGKIYVESVKGIGSEFSFTLPYRPAVSSTTRIRQPIKNNTTLSWSTKKCLLVDDNPDVLFYLRRILIDTGIKIFEACSGPEAIRIIKENPNINIVLLDMQMPGMNGIEVAKTLRQLRSDLPVIAQTAYFFENDKDIILEAGCDACLIKPIRKEDLISAMTMFMK